MKKLNQIVFIDDDDFTNSYHKKLAETSGLAESASFFSTPNDALNFLGKIDDKNAFPELIFIDIKMPGFDGHKVLEAIQDFSYYDPMKTVVAFLTNSLDVKDLIKADEANVELYFWKPLKKEVLEKIVDDNFNHNLS